MRRQDQQARARRHAGRLGTEQDRRVVRAREVGEHDPHRVQPLPGEEAEPPALGLSDEVFANEVPAAETLEPAPAMEEEPASEEPVAEVASEPEVEAPAAEEPAAQAEPAAEAEPEAEEEAAEASDEAPAE